MFNYIDMIAYAVFRIDHAALHGPQFFRSIAVVFKYSINLNEPRIINILKFKKLLT